MLVRYVKHYGINDTLTLEAGSVLELCKMMDEWKMATALKPKAELKRGSAEWFTEKESQNDET
jgi:hypothetical protein